MAKTSEKLILEAAKEVFIQKGYAGARMQEIADKAGINKAMLHYYYRKKEKLFLVIFQETMSEIISGLSQALEGKGSVMEKLEKVIRLYVDRLNKNPHVPLFVLHEISQNRLEFLEFFQNKLGHLPNFQQFFVEIIQEQAEGKIKKVPPMHLFLNVVSMSVFPFIVKPVFCNLMEVPEDQYQSLILENRADVVIDFMRNALRL